MDLVPILWLLRAHAAHGIILPHHETLPALPPPHQRDPLLLVRRRGPVLVPPTVVELHIAHHRAGLAPFQDGPAVPGHRLLAAPAPRPTDANHGGHAPQAQRRRRHRRAFMAAAGGSGPGAGPAEHGFRGREDSPPSSTSAFPRQFVGAAAVAAVSAVYEGRVGIGRGGRRGRYPYRLGPAVPVAVRTVVFQMVRRPARGQPSHGGREGRAARHKTGPHGAAARVAHDPGEEAGEQGTEGRGAGADDGQVALEDGHDEEAEGGGDADEVRAEALAQAEHEADDAGGDDEDAQVEDDGEDNLLLGGDVKSRDDGHDDEEEPGVGQGVEGGAGDEEVGKVEAVHRAPEEAAGGRVALEDAHEEHGQAEGADEGDGAPDQDALLGPRVEHAQVEGQDGELVEAETELIEDEAHVGPEDVRVNDPLVAGAQTGLERLLVGVEDVGSLGGHAVDDTHGGGKEEGEDDEGVVQEPLAQDHDAGVQPADDERSAYGVREHQAEEGQRETPI